jgi:uncharacterized lipoprotein YajG
MAQHSSTRLARGVLVAALLPLGASLFVTACAETDTTQGVQPAGQVEAGVLSEVDVALHQAVG